MSLSARIAIDPSRRVAFAERLVPLLGLGVATATLGTRCPAAAVTVLVVASLAASFVARRWSLRSAAMPYRFSLSDRAEFGAVLADGSAIDARLVESTVAWPCLWILAFAGVGSSRVTRLAVMPCELHPDARWSLGRFLFWALRTGDREEIPAR